MISLKDVGLVIKADGREVPIHDLPDGHYGPIWKVVDGRPSAPVGNRSRGLDPLKATR